MDFEKAFDHVNWDILDEIMAKMNFGNKWRSEALSFLIKQAQENGLISGFKVAESGTVVSHLQFADDTLILLDADTVQVENIRILLLSFEQLTGLKINFAKSEIFGVGYSGDIAQFSSILGCYHGVLPTYYPGLPLGDKSGGVAKWEMIMERFIKYLTGWKKETLNRAGKIALINSVLASLPVYYMSLFVMPASVDKSLEQIMRKFLWNDNKVSRTKDLTVADVFDANADDWNLLLPRRMLHAARLELSGEILWNTTSKGQFSVKTTYDTLANDDFDPAHQHIFQFIWGQNLPPKICLFLWTLSHISFPTRDMLRRRRIEVAPTYLSCNHHETVKHVFLHCSFAGTIWNHFKEKMKWNFTMPDDLFTMLLSWGNSQLHAQQLQILHMIPISIIWCIWKERNARAFQSKESNAISIQNRIKYTLFTWCLVFKNFEDKSFKYVMSSCPRMYFD
ncbi:uncharacterized protein LOC113295375 [Papaver somniferum]|uniref:uncharacterized protein LOC113295375 n=1 Tax=Papaver somniferum TaxID=3469 RepID=UPI000E7046FB|nr:uncharacterized protein LOC113295375 [Papaver somniferum]